MDVLDELLRIADAAKASEPAMRWLARQRAASRHLVFRPRRDVGLAPMYEIGTAEDPKRWSPAVKQAEPVRILQQLAKSRGAFISIELGQPGPRRQEFAKRRLDHAVEAIGQISPELADALRAFKVTDRGDALLAKLESRGARIEV